MSTPRSRRHREEQCPRLRPAVCAIAGAGRPVRPRRRSGVPSACAAVAANGTFFRNALDSCERLMRTPARASISARRRGIVQLRRPATGCSSKGVTTRNAVSLFTGAGTGATLAFRASRPPPAKSLRQRRTVSSRTPNASAIRGLVQPASVSSMARALSASPRSREPASVTRAARCSSVTVSGDFPARSCTCESVPPANQSAIRWSTGRILLRLYESPLLMSVSATVTLPPRDQSMGPQLIVFLRYKNLPRRRNHALPDRHVCGGRRITRCRRSDPPTLPVTRRVLHVLAVTAPRLARTNLQPRKIHWLADSLRVCPRTNRIISRSCSRLRTGKVAYFERIPGFPGRAARFSLSSQQVDLGWTLTMAFSGIPRLRGNPKKPLANQFRRDSSPCMIRAGFLDPESRRDLIDLGRDGSVAHRLARRANALVLLDDGMSCGDVAKVLLLDDDTVRTWHRLYQDEGIEGLASFGHDGSACRLSDAQQDKLKSWIAETLPRTTREVSAWIETECGIPYDSRSGLIALLHRLDMEHRKPKAVSSKLDPDKQAAFIKSYNNLLKHIGDDEAVLFGDAVHPTHAVRPVGCWAPKDTKLAVPQTSGRQRLNI